MKEILKEKQKLTNNCIIALNQIKKSQNVPHAISTYNNNVKTLNKLSNNFAFQLKNSTDVVINSNTTNNTTNNTDNNTDINTSNNTNSSINTHELRNDILSYSAIGASALGVTTMAVGSTILSLSYIQTMAAICAYYPAYVSSAASITSVSTWTFSQLLCGYKMAELTSMSTLSIVSMGVIAVGAIIVLIGIACLIAYVGYKKNWWS